TDANGGSISIRNMFSTATTVSSVSSGNAVGANNSRFAMEAHIHEGVRRLGISTDGNTAGTTGIFPGSNIQLAGLNGITLSQSTDAASNNTISVVGPGDMSRWFANSGPGGNPFALNEPPINNTVTIIRFELPEAISFTRVDIPVSISL